MLFRSGGTGPPESESGDEPGAPGDGSSNGGGGGGGGGGSSGGASGSSSSSTGNPVTGNVASQEQDESENTESWTESIPVDEEEINNGIEIALPINGRVIFGDSDEYVVVREITQDSIVLEIHDKDGIRLETISLGEEYDFELSSGSIRLVPVSADNDGAVLLVGRAIENIDDLSEKSGKLNIIVFIVFLAFLLAVGLAIRKFRMRKREEYKSNAFRFRANSEEM